MTPAEMVSTLRALGYGVRAPASDETVPTPEPLQVWRAESSAVPPRVILDVSAAGAVRYRKEHGKTVHRIWAADWRSWARRTGARPVVTMETEHGPS